jgi:RimJ/RimL family protein N-acetyltransferase
MENISSNGIDEMLTLDLLTLTDHTIAAGDVFDATTHRKALSSALEKSEIFHVRRNGALVAYCYVWPKSETLWFIGGFTLHPQFRNSVVMTELLSQLSVFLLKTKATHLQSNVYRTNRLSITFHKKLGFSITRENEKGLEFTAQIETLMQKPWATRRIKP